VPFEARVPPLPTAAVTPEFVERASFDRLLWSSLTTGYFE
jgi:hypothetical protein